MANLDDVLAATEFISRAEKGLDESGLKLGENRDKGLEGSGGTSVVSIKRVVDVETVVESSREVESVNQIADEIPSNGGTSAPVDEFETVVEASLDRGGELDSGLGIQKIDEILSNGDKIALVNEAGVEMMVDGNISGTSVVVSKHVVEVETVVESSLGCEAELQSCSVNQQMDDVSVLNNVKEANVEKNENDSSIGVENNGNSYSIDSKGSLEGTVDAEGKQVDHGFRVGDFVWGKIKSHPWWPGQIYDSKDAADFALKSSHEGRLLVAFFGDGSYNWCLPSQLVPFVDNLKKMSRGSQTGSFVNAIGEAVNEIGRIVESGIVCKCIPEEKRVDLARPLAVNAGLKAGVLTPEVESYQISVPELEPVDLLSKLRQFAVIGAVENALELSVMKSWLSAFYRFKCGSQLPVYRNALPIEGMEDPDQNVNDLSVPTEAPVVGPTDWFSSPTKTQADEKNSHKRKHKSIAELFGENTNVKAKSRKKAAEKEGTDLAIETSVQKGKKSDDSSSGKLSNSTRKNRKNRVSEVAKEGTDLVIETSSQKGKKGEDSSLGKISSKRKNRVSESSEVAETSNVGGTDGMSQEPLSEKPKEILVTPADATPGEEKEAFEVLSSPRERKKSKYLSPPYTNVTWRMGSSSFKAYKELESDNKKSKKDHKTQAIEGNGHLEEVDTNNVEASQTVKNDKALSFSVSDVDMPVDALLFKILCAAVDPLYLSKDGSFDMVFAFCSAMRSSTYAHGSDYKIFSKRKGSVPRKRKLSSLQCEIPENNQKTLKSVGAEGLAKRKKKKAKTTPGLKSNAGESGGKIAPSLIMIFKQGTALPSKEDIVNHYSKFGSLIDRDTRVIPDSQLVQIVFEKETEATKAFESSMKENSFGFENLLCDMLQTSPRPRSDGPCPEAPALKGNVSSDDLASDARALGNKLMLMSATFQKYHSKFSEDDKLMLKEEMIRLKEKAENVCETVDTISEARGAEQEASS